MVTGIVTIIVVTGIATKGMGITDTVMGMGMSPDMDTRVLTGTTTGMGCA
jgi:hypothetical protein